MMHRYPKDLNGFIFGPFKVLKLLLSEVETRSDRTKYFVYCKFCKCKSVIRRYNLLRGIGCPCMDGRRKYKQLSKDKQGQWA